MEEEPLLQAFWADVEVASPTTSEATWPSVREIQHQYPDQLIRYLKLHGVKKLGEARIAATELPGLFGGESLIARGSLSSSLDWEACWGITPLLEQPSSLSPAPPDGYSGTAAGNGGPRVASVLRAASRPAARQHAWLGARRWSGADIPPTDLRRASSDPWVLSSRSLPLPVPSTGAGTQQNTQPPPQQQGLSSASGPSGPPPTPSVVVESYLVAVRNAAAPGNAGLLRPLLRRRQLGSCLAGAFGLPAVQAVVCYKWSRFARRLLLQQLAAYGLWLGSFTAFMMLFNSSDAAITDVQLLATWKGRAAVAFEALALVAMLPFAAAEVCVVAAYGIGGWLSAWNLLDCATYGLQVAITVLHLGLFHNGPSWLTMAVAVQAILLVVRLTFFSRVFKSTTFDFMSSLQTVIAEVGWYIAVLLLLMWGFACAFFTIFRDDDAQDSFSSLPLSLLTMLNYAVGGTSYYMRGLLSSAQPAAALALCTTYQFLVSMLLMSLLTGVMTNALMKTAQQEAVALVLNRAEVIDELETVLPPTILRLLTAGARVPVTEPRDSGRGGATGGGCDDNLWMPYIHVLRVNPASLERIDGEERLWPNGAAAATASANEGGSDAMARSCGGGGGGGDPVVKGIGDSGMAAASSGAGSGWAEGAPQMARSGAPAGCGGGDARDYGPNVVRRLEAQVGRLEGQLTELQGAVRQLLEFQGDVRQLLGVLGRAQAGAEQQQQA